MFGRSGEHPCIDGEDFQIGEGYEPVQTGRNSWGLIISGSFIITEYNVDSVNRAKGIFQMLSTMVVVS